MYCLSEVQFFSSQSDWHSRYLSDIDCRLTSILKNDLGNSFWILYGATLTKYCNNKQLILRAKVIKNQSVSLVQIWRRKDDFLEYKKTALQGVDMKSLFEKNGLTVIESCREDFDDVFKYLNELKSYPHILQHISSEYYTPELVVGDPLKIGNLYLPFPNKQV